MEAEPPFPVTLPTLPDRPLVSVLVASFNYEAYVGTAIRSVLEQHYDGFEVIVCDDGSIDGSKRVIERLAKEDPRVRPIFKSNGGQASALNRAFTEAKGAICCILDADDTYEPEKVGSVVAAFASNPECGIATHDLRIIEDAGAPAGRLVFDWEGFIGPEISTLRLGLPLPLSSGLSYRREVLERILPLPEERFRSVADWAIAYSAAFLAPVIRVPDVLASYRVHGTNVSGTTSTGRRLEADRIAATLAGMEKVLAFVNESLATELNPRIVVSRVRNVLEHRMMLGILRRDRELVRDTQANLKEAFIEVRRDYPRGRYLFWIVMARLPAAVARAALNVAFCAFRARSRFLAPS